MASFALGPPPLAEEEEEPSRHRHSCLPDAAALQPDALGAARTWIEQVTGRSFGDKDFRSGLKSGVLLCELLNSIKPGLIQKLNRLPSPAAESDNISSFLRGCKDLGLKASQLFSPGDLQDFSSRATVKNLDCSRKLKNENEDVESPKRSIRDSGYVDCWDSERSDSLSPPRHGRDDSFDSLDSFGSRSQQTPSPDVVLRGSSDGRGSDSESDLPTRKMPDVKKDDMSARRVSYSEPKSVVPFNQYLPNKSNLSAYVPAPLRKKKVEREEYRKSWSTASSPLGGERPFRFTSRTPVSDDAESLSMVDVRCAEEVATVQPHSKVHQEKLQTIHHQLKEDEDQWQDDLARWKSRRRSVSQDLFKKEAERKKMERLLTAAEGTTERRKSIKTYREIVEEKERREEVLQEAYKSAKSHEEAERILQHYIERFTISEAVLERLKMPKILERSHSAEPNSSSPPKDSDPLRFLRQELLPAPKYTAKVEATVAPASVSNAGGSTGRTSPSKPFISKAVPILTPKPYLQPKNTQPLLKTFKVDGKISVNGETVNGVEEERARECTGLIFVPSSSRFPKSDVTGAGGTAMETKQESGSAELVLKKLMEHSQGREQADSLCEEAQQTSQKDTTGSERASAGLAAEHKDPSMTIPSGSPPGPSVEISSIHDHSKKVGCSDDQEKPEAAQLKDAEEPAIQKALNLEAPEQDGSIIFPMLKTVPEISQVVLQFYAPRAADMDNSDKSKRFGCRSWDPEDERRRQEQWQHEQERLLQDRYQKEQEKLKEEWAQAQKEVEEEGRRYYEEERKIIEDTVVPFMITSNSADPLSTASSVTDGNRTGNIADMSNSEEEEKPKDDRTPKAFFFEHHRADFSKHKECEPGKGNMSINNLGDLQSKNQRAEQRCQSSMPECKPPSKMTLPLSLDVPQNQQTFAKESLQQASDVIQKTTPSEQTLGLKASSTRESRRVGYQESFQPGPPSPCSPSVQSQSPSRSISGKKLCSSCGQTLGKGAAMIIETLGLYFHMQCFRCGICKGQLGDAASGTDVRIRNGLLNCNECYIRSRTAGQPTTL